MSALCQKRTSRGSTIFDLKVSSFDPPCITHAQAKCPKTRSCFGIVFGKAKQHTDPPHPGRLLCVPGQRPGGC
jgi:hypothetical protein